MPQSTRYERLEVPRRNGKASFGDNEHLANQRVRKRFSKISPHAPDQLHVRHSWQHRLSQELLHRVLFVRAEEQIQN